MMVDSGKFMVYKSDAWLTSAIITVFRRMIYDG
jgi:hypothetical protein